MDAVKAEINSLMQQRSAIEAEIKQRTDRLDEPGMPGMKGSLLDKEGFPRSDIDIHAVRTDRNAIIRLTNDHKQISSQLEQLLHKLHALAREVGVVGNSSNSQPTPAPAPSAPSAAATSQPLAAETAAAQAAAVPANASAAAAPTEAALRPFAVVDEVADESPAAAAGIQLGDQLCRFGSAVAGSGSELQQVASELQQHEDQEVSVVFMRAGQQVQLTLVPRKWEGRGLLGCHLRPL